MYRLLVGDIALQRGQGALGARAYFEAARDAKSVFLARRATEIALASRQRATALLSARLWSELDPDAERPKQIAEVLAKEGTDLPSLAGPGLQEQLRSILAEAAKKEGGAGEAFMQLNALLQHDPDHAATLKLVQDLAGPYDNVPEAHYAVALAALGTGLTDLTTSALARREVDRALALKPGWDRALLLKTEIIEKQSPDEATTFLENAVKDDATSRPLAGALAQRYIQQKRYAEARAIFERLLESDPGNRQLQMALAALSMQMKDWSAAEAQFKALQDAGKDEDGTIALYLAEIAEEQGKYDLAMERYRAVPEGERGWVAKLRIATVLGKMKRIDEAQKYLADLPAVTIEQRVQVRQTEAQILRDAGRNDAAYAVLEKGLAEHPDQIDLLYDAAMVAEKMNRIDSTEAHLRRIIELKPDNAQALNALGYTLVDRTRRYDEGLQLIERAHKLAPDDAFILDSMGWALYRVGKLDEAERYLRRAMAGRPDAEIAAHLGEVLWAKGDHTRAQEIWQTQLKSAPDNEVLLETVRRLAR